ncbi:MAG: MmcQ/YjbR family DNA-binding protein [Anaerolineales bacterium]
MALVRSKKGKAVLAKVRKIAMKYPEVTEIVDGFGHSVFKVRNKSFIFVSEYKGRLNLILRLLHETQDFLIHHTSRFEKSPYIGQHGWTTLKPEYKIDWGEVEGFIDEAYRRTAPKTVLKKLAE